MDPLRSRLAAYDTMRRLGATLLIDDIDDVGDGVINTDSPWGVPAPHHWTLGAALLTMGVVAERDARERIGAPVEVDPGREAAPAVEAARDDGGGPPTLDYDEVVRNQRLRLEGGPPASVDDALADLDAAFETRPGAD